MKALRLTLDEWLRIYTDLHKHHPKSVLMVRWKMKEVLGFTNREHKIWDGRFKTEIHLDFYSEPKRTMFLLKYSEWIGRKNENC